MSVQESRMSDAAGTLSRQECQALFNRLVAMATGGGGSHLSFTSEEVGGSKWVKNRMQISSDVHRYSVGVSRNVRGASGGSSGSRIDDDGILELVQRAENALSFSDENPEAKEETFQDQPTLQPTLWSESTNAFGVAARTKLAQDMMAPSEAAGLWSAGDLLIKGQGPAVLNTTGLFRYYPVTEVECSITVRDRKSTASGWAGVNHYDLAKINPLEIAARALDKCQRSVNAVVLEPGRYTAILEPQAVTDLFDPLTSWLDRPLAEQGAGPFTNGLDSSKIGERVLDPRLMLRADPMHPESGFVPFDRESGEAYRPVTWIDEGVLRELGYGRSYARSNFGTELGLPNSGSYMLMPMPGIKTSTVDEMVASTKRGVLVTRLWDVRVMDSRSMMSAGYTRDGVWLVEDGKVKYPVKNFRFTDSPLFALNSLEMIGPPVRTFRPGRAVMAPPVRVRDFNFSGLSDAV